MNGRVLIVLERDAPFGVDRVDRIGAGVVRDDDLERVLVLGAGVLRDFRIAIIAIPIPCEISSELGEKLLPPCGTKPDSSTRSKSAGSSRILSKALKG